MEPQIPFCTTAGAAPSLHCYIHFLLQKATALNIINFVGNKDDIWTIIVQIMKLYRMAIYIAYILPLYNVIIWCALSSESLCYVRYYGNGRDDIEGRAHASRAEGLRLER